ncbi:MAG: hypothetical protein FWG40_03660 [Peptococcaceae bacterium]|nr:hypothetical protein [Peptococcaceae bacterium]
MENRLDLANRIEELGQTTIEAIEHASALLNEDVADALTTLPIMTEVLEAYNAIGEVLPLMSEEDKTYSRGGDMTSVDRAFAVLVKAYEQKDLEGVRDTLRDDVLPLYRHWFDNMQDSLPHIQH